ncbi:hypothetical protein KC316_g2515 [Hortaea werneckii]|nr:hypothetical protein KC324_g2503 [Hortaea werneckii]KAI7592068.1 hypothetical protein KC316_g2515 [Hortaea werneckii]
MPDTRQLGAAGLRVPMRQRFAQQIDEWEENPEDLLEAFEEADKHLQDSFGFRWGAQSTLNKQDRALNEYRRLTTLDLRRKNQAEGLVFGPDVSADINDRLLFPVDADELVERIGRYLYLAATRIKPRSLTKSKISACPLLERRTSMWYWIDRGRKAVNKPSPSSYFQRTSEVIESWAKKHGFEHNEKTRIYLGREELKYLIDCDLGQTSNIEVHEQHALAWTISLAIGVRPGSICKSTIQPNRYLRLGDVTIERDLDPDRPNGSFVARFVFKGLKTRVQARRKAPKWLKIKCRTPAKAEDIGLSIPHRILVILLRRKLLAEHETLESLLAGNELVIKLKDGSADQPLFLASRPQGLGVTDQPMSVAGLAGYLTTRAKWAGFSEGVSPYSWRAKALTTTREASGASTARMLAAHHADSVELEEYYDQGLYQYDAVGVLLDGGEDPRAQRLLAEIESERMRRTPLAQQSAARKATVDAYVFTHPSYLQAVADGNPREVRQIIKRLRYGATLACLEEERQLQRRELTVQELKRRKEELNQPGALRAMIHERMAQREQQRRSSADDEGEEEDVDDLLRREGADNPDEMRDIEDSDEDEEYEEDNEQPEDGETAEVTIDEGDLPETSTDFFGTVAAFMDLLLQFAENAEPRGDLCDLCQIDPTISSEQKEKRYLSAANLDGHRKGPWHYPISKWERAYKEEHDVSKGNIPCPYNCGNVFKGMIALKNHIKAPFDPEVNSSEHDELKRKDGWYSADFEGVKTKKRARKPKKTKQPTPRAQYNTDITELPPGTPGIWAQEPTAVGLVEFGRGAALNALRSVPKEFLTTDVASMAGPAPYQRFGDHLLQDAREFKLSAAAKSLLKPAGQVGTRQTDFYPDANALYISRLKELEEQRLGDEDEMDLDEEEEEEEEEMDSDNVEVGSEGEAE